VFLKSLSYLDSFHRPPEGQKQVGYLAVVADPWSQSQTLCGELVVQTHTRSELPFESGRRTECTRGNYDETRRVGSANRLVVALGVFDACCTVIVVEENTVDACVIQDGQIGVLRLRVEVEMGGIRATARLRIDVSVNCLRARSRE
jgi:hypothetical protein